MGKLRNLAVFGAGYVLGAQAGRARYEQIKQRATQVAGHPRTQALVQRARDEAQTRLPAAVTGRLGGRPGGAAEASGAGHPHGGHGAGTDQEGTGQEPVVQLTDQLDGDLPVRPTSHL